MINFLWTFAAICCGIALVCAVVILVIFAFLMVQMDRKNNEVYRIPEPTFEGPSRFELNMTTARLLREDKRRPRKRHAQVIYVR